MSLSALGMIGVGSAVAGAQSLMGLGNNLISGSIFRGWNRKDSKNAALEQYGLNKKFNEWLIPYQLQQNYDFAERYARNSPLWNVQGLRKAGLNPILAASGGFSGGHSPSSSVGSSGSVSAPHSSSSGLPSPDIIGVINGLKQNELLGSQNISLKLDNALKRDNLKTAKAENLVKRLKAEAESDILKPEYKGGLEGVGKEVHLYVKSEGFKALQKAIRDDYDLRSEKYLRETIDAVMRYGVDVLKLLPAFRQQQIMETIQKTVKTTSKGKTSTIETYTTHGPKK